MRSNPMMSIFPAQVYGVLRDEISRAFYTRSIYFACASDATLGLMLIGGFSCLPKLKIDEPWGLIAGLMVNSLAEEPVR